MRTFAILIILKCLKFSGIKCIHCVGAAVTTIHLWSSSHLRKRTLCIHSALTCHYHLLQVLAKTILRSFWIWRSMEVCSVYLSVLGHFTSHSVLKVHLCCSEFPSFLSVNSILLCVYTILCLFIHWWTLGLLTVMLFSCITLRYYTWLWSFDRL